MKTMIVGPYRFLSEAPGDSLSPLDEKTPIGHSLWELMNERTGVTKEEYVELFDRRGLCVSRWSHNVASAYFNSLPLAQYDLILFVGSNAKSVVPQYIFYPQLGLRNNMAFVPYPGVGSRFYQNPIAREAATILLEEVYWFAKS